MRGRDYVTAVLASSPTKASSLSGSSTPRLDMARRRLWMPERTRSRGYGNARANPYLRTDSDSQAKANRHLLTNTGT